MNKKLIPGVVLALLMIIQLACNAGVPTSAPDTVATLNGLYTAAAQTATAAVPGSVFTATPGLPLPTATFVQPLPTSTPFVILTNTPGPVARCDAAAFVRDVSVVDGSVFSRGASFTKTWRLQNVGTCSWTPSYALVFTGGDSMNGPSAAGLGATVNPGQSIDVSVSLIAPSTDGHYRGYWKLRNASGSLFGVGAQADVAFWADIVVKGPAYAAFDFISNFCDAEWESNSGPLACPGTEGDEAGYVLRVDSPKLENGDRADGASLLTFPRDNRNGFITGTYPAVTVERGDRFRALLSCGFNNERCNVIFRLEFRSAGQVYKLGTWNEAYEGRFFTVDVDLNSLAGMRGKFILTVLANGSARDDAALWVSPRIVRNGNPPPTLTPSITPTPTLTLTPTVTPPSRPPPHLRPRSPRRPPIRPRTRPRPRPPLETCVIILTEMTTEVPQHAL